MDIIRKKEKVFISPIQEIKGKKRRIWPKVVLVLAIIVLGALFLTAIGFFVADYFKAKNLDNLVKLAPNSADSYLYLNKEKINNEVLKNNNLIFESKKAKEILPADLKIILGNENAYASLNNSSIFILKEANLELFKNNILNNAKISFFDYRDVKIYNVKFGNNKNFVYSEIGNNLIISDSEDALRLVVDCSIDPRKSLMADKYFAQINKKLVANSFLYYFSKKPSEIFNSLVKSDASVFSKNIFGNFLFLRAEEKDSNIDLKIYTDMALEKQFSFKEPFKYLPNKTILAYSSNNLQKVYNNLKNDANNDESLKFLKSFDEQLKNTYGLDLEQDLMPLFANNFEFIVLPDKKDKNAYAVILEINNEQILATKMKTLEDSLIKYYARLKPREKKAELADGTEGIELLPDVSKLKFVNSDFENYKLRKMVEKDDEKNINTFAYCFFDNKLFLASSADTLKDILKSLENENAKIVSSVKANNGLLYLSSLNFLNSLGLELNGTLTAGFEDGNIINGIVRIY